MRNDSCEIETIVWGKYSVWDYEIKAKLTRGQFSSRLPDKRHVRTIERTFRYFFAKIKERKEEKSYGFSIGLTSSRNPRDLKNPRDFLQGRTLMHSGIILSVTPLFLIVVVPVNFTFIFPSRHWSGYFTRIEIL